MLPRVIFSCQAESVRMIRHVSYGLLFAYFALPGGVLGELAFRCPSCSAEQLAACPKVTRSCAEIVREPGCGCCPVCARQEGELCGVYSPRCSSGLRCYPSSEIDFPLQQLIQGLGRCVQKVDLDVTNVEKATNEVLGTETPLTKRPAIEALNRQELARIQYMNQLKTKMKTQVDPRVPQVPQAVTKVNHVLCQEQFLMQWCPPLDSHSSACQLELDKVLEEISKMTSEDNRGPLENLYVLKFPNCDKYGLYNLKQCNMSTHGQRGECWCVDPLTGVQIPATPKVRGDPNCNQFHEEQRLMPTAAAVTAASAASQ